MHSVRTHRTGSVSRNRVLTRAVTAAAAAAIVGLATASTHAADVHWNVADGNWDVPENWAPLPGDPAPPPAVPGAADRAVIDFAGGGTAHVTTDVADILTLQVTAGNTLSIEPGGNVTALIGGTTAGEPPAPINDPLQAVRIGDGGIGTVILNDGTLQNPYTNAAANNGADLYIGVGTGGAGTLTQSGTLAQLTARDLRVGSDGATGTVTVSGGNVTTNFTIIGRVGGTGHATLSGGGTMSSIGQFNLGTGGGGLDGTGTMTQTGGTLAAAVASIGRGGSSTGTARGFGTYTLNDGLVDANFSAGGTTNGHVVVGMNGGKGTMTMNGGTVTTDGGLYVAYNDAGNVNNRSEGDLTLHGGTATVGGMFQVGYAAASGTMTMDGGTVTVTGMSGVGFDDRTANTRATLTTGTLTQTGGTINANGGFTVARGSGSGTYTLDNNAVLNVGTGTTGDLVIGQTDAVTVAHTMSGQLNIGGNASVTVAGALRMGANGGKGTLTTTGGTLVVTGNSVIADGGTGPIAIANLGGGTASFAGSLTVGDGGGTNGTLNVTAGTLNVTGALVAGRQTTVSGVISQSGGIINAGSLGIRTGTGSVAATDFNLSGGTLNVAGAVTNNSTFDASGTGVAHVGAIGGTGTMTVADTALVNAASVRQASLAMTGGTVKIAETGNGTAAGVSRLGNYSLNGDARFDLRDNKLVADKPLGTFNGTSYDGVHGDIARAYNFGAWDQPGLTTSEDLANPLSGPLGGTTTIAVNKASEVLFIGDTDTALFAGQTVTGATTIAMYTYAGDVNLDGLVDAADYGVIDNWIQFPGTDGYMNGDFNYDGVIDAADYGIIDNSIQLQGAPFLGVNDAFAGASSASLAGVTAVPEPSAFGLAVVAAAVITGRRKRRR